jgi:hypothetical protein
LPAKPTNPDRSGLATRLVPIVATRLEVCRYDLLSRPGALSEHFTLVDPSSVRSFENATNALSSIGTRRYYCPNDNGTGIVVILSDAARSIALRVSLSGCAFVSNGVRTAAPSPTWHATVASIAMADCPFTAPEALAVERSPLPGLDKTVVPIAATSVRVCRYAPFDNPHKNTLTAFGVLVDQPHVSTLETQANGLRRISNTERVPCPLFIADPTWLIRFSNATSHVDLLESPTNCGDIFNGVSSAARTSAWTDALTHVATLR